MKVLVEIIRYLRARRRLSLRELGYLREQGFWRTPDDPYYDDVDLGNDALWAERTREEIVAPLAYLDQEEAWDRRIDRRRLAETKRRYGGRR